MQISVPIQRRNSGGPVFDQAGNVIGVVVSKLDALKMARRGRSAAEREFRDPQRGDAQLSGNPSGEFRAVAQQRQAGKHRHRGAGRGGDGAGALCAVTGSGGGGSRQSAFAFDACVIRRMNSLTTHHQFRSTIDIPRVTIHDGDEIGPKMLARVAKHTGLTPNDL